MGQCLISKINSSSKEIVKTAYTSNRGGGGRSLSVSGTFKPCMVVVNSCNQNSANNASGFNVYGTTADGTNITLGTAYNPEGGASNSGGWLDSFSLDGNTIYTRIYCTTTGNATNTYAALAVYEFR